MNYQLTMNQDQAILVANALGLYSRLRCGHWGELGRLCLNQKDPQYKQKREQLNQLMLQVRSLAFPELVMSPISNHKPEDFPQECDNHDRTDGPCLIVIAVLHIPSISRTDSRHNSDF